MPGANEAAGRAAVVRCRRTGSWYVYVLATERGTLYTGITTDVTRRLREHQRSPRGARYFRLTAAARLLYVEAHDSRSSASRREAAIKRLTRTDKFALIARAGSPVQQAVLVE